MKSKEDQAWENLLRAGAPTFAGEGAPPFGFVTSTLAQMRAARNQQRELERVGWRALWASVATVALVAVLTVGLQWQNQGQGDLYPGMRNIIEVGNVPVS